MKSAMSTALCSLIFTSLVAVPAGMSADKECRAKQFVINSAQSLQANRDANGHVERHIPNNPTKKNETMFADWDAAHQAFTTWSGMQKAAPAPKKCGANTKGKRDCVNAADLGVTQATTCLAVSKGKCTSQSAPFVPAKVAFRYAFKKNKEGKANWMLNTAYPTANANCN